MYKHVSTSCQLWLSQRWWPAWRSEAADLESRARAATGDDVAGIERIEDPPHPTTPPTGPCEVDHRRAPGGAHCTSRSANRVERRGRKCVRESRRHGSGVPPGVIPEMETTMPRRGGPDRDGRPGDPSRPGTRHGIRDPVRKRLTCSRPGEGAVRFGLDAGGDEARRSQRVVHTHGLPEEGHEPPQDIRKRTRVASSGRRRQGLDN